MGSLNKKVSGAESSSYIGFRFFLGFQVYYRPSNGMLRAILKGKLVCCDPNRASHTHAAIPIISSQTWGTGYSLNFGYMGSLNKKASGAQCFIMALGLFLDIVTGLPGTPNGDGSLEPKGYCIFLLGAHYLTINSPDGAVSSLNKLLLLSLRQGIEYRHT